MYTQTQITLLRSCDCTENIKMLKKQMKNQKDIYFYDDTHWSPWASKIIANELERVIRKKQ